MIFAIGDIHGCDGLLDDALGYLRGESEPSDTVVFLGDYIDRGPDSRRAIDLLLGFREYHPKTVFLRGNHEQMLIDAREEVGRLDAEGGNLLDSDAFLLWWQNGGSETIRSYGGSLKTWAQAIPPHHWEFVLSTQMEYAEGGYHFVHAGFLPDGVHLKWAEPGRDPRLWIREEFHHSDADFGGRIVVFGHTPQLSGKPYLGRNKIGLDTAAVFGGLLTVAHFDPEALGADRLTFGYVQFP